MLEGLKEALQYVNGLKEESMQPIVTEIAGKTYCNKDLKRYGREDLAGPIHVNTLSAMVDYITGKRSYISKARKKWSFTPGFWRNAVEKLSLYVTLL